MAIFFVITNLIITFLFLSRFQAKYEYRIYAILLSSILVLMLILWSIKFKFNFLISKALMKQILSYGLPLLPHAFGLRVIRGVATRRPGSVRRPAVRVARGTELR